MSELEAEEKQSENKISQGFTFEQHKQLGRYIKRRRSEALNLSVVSTWCHNKSSTVCTLAGNMENMLSLLQFHLHNIVCSETPANSLLFNNGYNPEIDPVICYHGRTEFAERWGNEFIAGFREKFYQQQPSEGLYTPRDLPRRRRGFQPNEHLHVAKIMRFQIRQSAIVTTLMWNAYGTDSPATRTAYKWWKEATDLTSTLDKLTGKTGIYDITYPPLEEADRFKVEIAAYQKFAEPLVLRLEKFLFHKKTAVIDFGKITNPTRNQELGWEWLTANFTEL
ncbi:MAG: hypothetical protein ACRC62_38345 [Microcoleus sp.]